MGLRTNERWNTFGAMNKKCNLRIIDQDVKRDWSRKEVVATEINMQKPWHKGSWKKLSVI